MKDVPDIQINSIDEAVAASQGIELARSAAPAVVPRVVIVGAGFGGIHAARASRDAPVQVTVIDRNNHHLFQPLLYLVATPACRANSRTPRCCWGRWRGVEMAGAIGGPAHTFREHVKFHVAMGCASLSLPSATMKRSYIL